MGTTTTGDDARDGMMPDVYTAEERRWFETEAGLRSLEAGVKLLGHKRTGRVMSDEEAQIAIDFAIGRETLRREAVIRDGKPLILHHHTPLAARSHLLGMILDSNWPAPFTGRERVVLNFMNDGVNGTRAPGRCHRLLLSAIAREAQLRTGWQQPPEVIQEILWAGVSKLFLLRAEGKGVPSCLRAPAQAKFFAKAMAREYYRDRRVRKRMVLADSQRVQETPEEDREIIDLLRSAPKECFNAVVRRLSVIDRHAVDIFLLRVVKELAFNAIAAMLKLSPGNVSRIWTGWVVPVAVGAFSGPEHLKTRIRAQLLAIRAPYAHLFDGVVLRGDRLDRASRDLGIPLVKIQNAVTNKVIPIVTRTTAAQAESRWAIRHTLMERPDGSILRRIFDAAFVYGADPNETCASIGITPAAYRRQISEVIQPVILQALRTTG